MNISFGDIRDPQFTDNLCKDIDVVFNLAALISIPHSYISTKSYIETNILGTNNILHSALKSKISNSYKLPPVKYMELQRLYQLKKVIY